MRELDDSPAGFLASLQVMTRAVEADSSYGPALVDEWYFRQLIAAWRHRRHRIRRAREAHGSMKAFYALFLPEVHSDPIWSLIITIYGRITLDSTPLGTVRSHLESKSSTKTSARSLECRSKGPALPSWEPPSADRTNATGVGIHLE